MSDYLLAVELVSPGSPQPTTCFQMAFFWFPHIRHNWPSSLANFKVIVRGRISGPNAFQIGTYIVRTGCYAVQDETNRWKTKVTYQQFLPFNYLLMPPYLSRGVSDLVIDKRHCWSLSSCPVTWAWCVWGAGRWQITIFALSPQPAQDYVMSCQLMGQALGHQSRSFDPRPAGVAYVGTGLLFIFYSDVLETVAHLNLRFNDTVYCTARLRILFACGDCTISPKKISPS